MRISHIAMYVRDLEVVKEFYIRFFGAKAGELYHNPKTGLKSYFLSFDEGTRLELMNLPEMQDRRKCWCGWVISISQFQWEAERKWMPSPKNCMRQVTKF